MPPGAHQTECINLQLLQQDPVTYAFYATVSDDCAPGAISVTGQAWNTQRLHVRQSVAPARALCSVRVTAANSTVHMLFDTAYLPLYREYVRWPHRRHAYNNRDRTKHFHNILRASSTQLHDATQYLWHSNTSRIHTSSDKLISHYKTYNHQRHLEPRSERYFLTLTI